MVRDTLLSVENSPEIKTNSPSTSKQEIKNEYKKYSKFESSPEIMDEENLTDDNEYAYKSGRFFKSYSESEI